ncbi:hypothetical protein MGA5115_01559 [Marinomonas gallaica]|uniref:DUF4402 domain-containing protein n=1 Tax=Marinomonas gallaica TaxID=1806667 RepID=A0A1C3JQE7_9GAMM|nr:DUF4402 domain-containing protein [Marinomonas gallaica]SBT17448.1 hypothetical protein MGA5115_01559 [Marinomonas gallaica]SBT19640.1 hypothetical protein MGA5116_00213 [Marinomonas gallaica]
MKQLKKIYLIAGVTTILTGNALAVETLNSNATVTVNNAFTLAESAEMTFGTIRASADTTNNVTASLTLPADGSAGTVTAATPAASNIVVITGGTPASFAITNAAPFTTLTLTLPSSAIDLVTPGGDAQFTVDSFNAVVSSGPNDGDAYNSGTPNLRTDASGAVSFDVGATLITDATTPGSNYEDGTYTGSYTVQVDY